MKVLVLLLFSLFTACSFNTDKIIKSALEVSKTDVEGSLKILDQALKDESNPEQKLEYILVIEKIIKEKLKKADYYKAILEKKLIYLKDPIRINQTTLTISQLLIQNLKKENEALNYLSKVDLENITPEQRELYFQSILVAYINGKKFDQAIIEAGDFLKRKDLAPSERFKILALKARALISLEKQEGAEKEYERMLNDYPNLSKKWKIRSQLALILEGQKKYKEALKHLKAHLEEEGGKDELLQWRIKELTKRLAQQPGGKGRLKR